MKEIKAILQPFKVNDVVNALQALPGMGGITQIPVEGYGRRKGKYGREEAAKGSLHLLTRVMLLMVVPDSLVDDVLETIRKTAHTGNPGDGKVIVSPVDTAMRVRTNERGNDAL